MLARIAKRTFQFAHESDELEIQLELTPYVGGIPVAVDARVQL